MADVTVFSTPDLGKAKGRRDSERNAGHDARIDAIYGPDSQHRLYAVVVSSPDRKVEP